MSGARRVGRYEILDELGRGGMARVHLARQLDLDRYVALKELGSLQREDAEMVARLLRESRLAGALNHPSIVTVYEFFEHDGIRYIAMEYVPGGSVRPWVGRLELAQVGGTLENLLAGLAHAHAAGVVHRDVKPENLLVTGEGRVKITDFGIAKALAEHGSAAFRTATGVALGTPTYMAPEQAMAQDIGPRTDLYATGVIAYELLSGTPPFVGSEPLAVLLAHTQQPPPPLAEHAPDVPEPIVDWVHGLLAKEPAERPESARAAWEELEEHLLECVGPRWRRSARLEPRPGAAPSAPDRPATPAPFPSDPRSAPGERDSDAWETFGGNVPSREPEVAPSPVPQATPSPAPAALPASEQEAEPAPAGAGPPSPPPPAATVAPSVPQGHGDPPSPPAARRRPRAMFLVAPVVAAIAIVAVVLATGGGDGGSGPPADDVGAPAAAQASVAPLGSDWTRGVHVVSYESDGLAKPSYVRVLRRVNAAGGTHVIVHPILDTPSTRSSELVPKPGAPTDETLAEGIRVAEREGLQTIVQPFLEVDGNQTSYSGEYEPDDPDAFFAAYEERLAAYADIAGEEGAGGVVVGTSLSLLDGADWTDRWTAMLEHARERCGCNVTYAAENIDGAERVQFWGAADLIGLDYTAPVFTRASTDPAELADAWSPIKTRLEALNVKWDKPVTLVSLGYMSRAGQAAVDAYDDENAGEPSEAAQAALYEAAFRAFHGTPWFAGIGWFELDASDPKPKPGDHSFVGREAERVLRDWQTAE
jgi:serine/threonine protein kinase